MKRFKRLFLGITRRPIQSIILILAVFIMVNVISASFMLFHSSNQVVNTIQNEIAPSVYFHSLLSPRDSQLSKQEQEKISYIWNSLSTEERVEMENNHMLALQEISQLSEVKYSDFGINSSMENPYLITFNHSGLIGFSCSSETEFECKTALSPYQTIGVLGVYQANHFYLKQNKMEIIEGRNFTDEEIAKGEHVVLVPFHAKFQNNQDIQVNDQLVLSNHIISDFEHTKDYKSLDAYNQKCKENILEDKEIVFTVIGIYKDPNLNKRYSQGLNEAYGEDAVMMPLNTLEEMLDMKKEMENTHINEITQYENFKVNDVYRKDRYNYFELNRQADIESFTMKAKQIFNKYGLKYHKINVSNDLYLKLAGPLAGIHTVSKTILIAGCILFFIIMVCISLLFTKDRKKEIGLLLSFGESQKNIIQQMLGEIILIGLLGIILSYATTPFLAKVMNNNLINNAPIETLNKSETNLVDETKVDPELLVLEYQRGLKSDNILMYSFVCLGILGVSASCSNLVNHKTETKRYFDVKGEVMNILEVKDLYFTYPDGNRERVILNYVSASFEQGKFYTILGTSGSGKTTFLSLISALDKAKSGCVLYNGEDIEKIGIENYRRNHVGLIFQNYNLIAYMSALENVLVPMGIIDKKADKPIEKALRVLENLGIDEKKAKRRVNKLSGGEQQRVAIARILACDVDIIIADEPTGNLDNQTSEKIIEIFQKLAHEENKCVIVVTHSSSVANKSDCIMRLSSETQNFTS